MRAPVSTGALLLGGQDFCPGVLKGEATGQNEQQVAFLTKRQRMIQRFLLAQQLFNLITEIQKQRARDLVRCDVDCLITDVPDRIAAAVAGAGEDSAAVG